MTNHKIGTREEWVAARLELLEAEKALTRRSDELGRWRQELPWVRIDKEYRFETEEGTASLADLFRGRSQLLKRKPTFRDLFVGLDVPRAFIVGSKTLEADARPTSGEDGEGLEKVSIGRIVVPDAGHPMVDQNPDGFARAVGQALEASA